MKRYEPQYFAPTPERRMPEIHTGTPGHDSILMPLTIVRETEKAWLVEHPTDPRGKMWLPRSLCRVAAERFMEAPVFRIPAWLCFKNAMGERL